ncbi:MAG TPA: acyltransferase [Candidatus Moranbacteria bacterium]|nr:acyltransferase [Candidatus Moranbacteria bacterium]
MITKLKQIIHLAIRNFFLSGFYTKTFGTVYILKPRLFGDPARFKVSDSATINNAFLNTLSGKITIEDDVFFGQNVSVLTGSHDLNKFGKERFKAVVPDGNDILICKGAWIASNSTIIGPCVIGEHSVVAAGSVVNKNVPSYAVVGGIPAKIIKEITH